MDEAILLADRVVMMTNGPRARIGKIMQVDLPRPRTRKALLEHPRYYAYREELLSFLEEYEHGAGIPCRLTTTIQGVFDDDQDMLSDLPQARSAGCLLATGAAHADGLDPVKGAFGETKYIFDSRLRMEDVDQDPLARGRQCAHAALRLGFETGKAWNTALLVEGEAVMPLDDDYRPDPAVPEMITYPVVADAEAYEINRFQLTNTSLPGTTLTLGRQRILLDDQRFVGNSAGGRTSRRSTRCAW